MKRIQFLLFILLSSQVIGQQLASLSQFQQADYTRNPAMTGSSDISQKVNLLEVDIAYRRQWTGFENGPSLGFAGLRYEMAEARMSFGGFAFHEQFGPTDYTSLSAFYAYHLPFSNQKMNVLSIGIGASVTQNRLDGTELQLKESSDPLAINNAANRISPNVSLGLFYKTQLGDQFEDNPYYIQIGVSMEQAITGDVLFETSFGEFSNLKREKHFHFTVALRKYYDNGLDYFEPMLWIRRVIGVPTNVWSGIRSTFLNDQFALSAAYSSDGQTHLSAGIRLEQKIRISYSSSFYVKNPVGAGAGMTHEILLSYDLDMSKR